MSDAHDRKQPAASRARKARSSSDEGDDEQATPAAEPGEPKVCMACHGTGKVISNLDEHARKVSCPWCRGGGERLIGEDAQEYQQEQAGLKRH
jgi:DnaJ-class molecular chaperone